tara:strand:- start:767 stop:1183 length:417 start_codon:yes stop_codon:yes gene_type:complete
MPDRTAGPIIAVDFDGTIVQHKYPEIGELCPYADTYLKQFVTRGARLILYTMRSEAYLLEAEQFVKSLGIDLWAVNLNPTQHTWTTSRKVYAHLYIDDAAAGTPLTTPHTAARPHVDWVELGPMVNRWLYNWMVQRHS